METLSIIGTIILIIIGLFIVVLLAYAIRILILIYSFLGSKEKRSAEFENGGISKFGRFIRSASVIEIIFFLLRNKGRFRR